MDSDRSPHKNNSMTMRLSRHRILKICHSEQTLVAKIVNTATGHTMTMSYGSLLNIMGACSFVINARESLLSEEERRLLKDNLVTPKLTVKRKLTFADSSPEMTQGNSNQSSPVIPPSQIHMGFYEDAQRQDSDSDSDLVDMTF